MTFYYAPHSCSVASHITLEETGASYRAKLVDFSVGEQRSEAYKKINPKGKVPVLCDGDNVITENVAIQYYLAERYPDRALYPADPLQRIHWLSTISWISNTIHPDARHITRPENYTEDPEGIPAVIAKGKKTLARLMGELDERLAGNEWMMGRQYTTADPYALVFVGVAKKYGVTISGLDHIRRWLDAMLERKAVRSVLELEGSVLLQGR